MEIIIELAGITLLIALGVAVIVAVVLAMASAVVCLLDMCAKPSKKDRIEELEGYAAKHISLIRDLESEQSSQKQETAKLRKQLVCPCNGNDEKYIGSKEHWYTNNSQGYLYLFSCSRCGLNWEVRKDELTLKQRNALITLGIIKAEKKAEKVKK